MIRLTQAIGLTGLLLSQTANALTGHQHHNKNSADIPLLQQSPSSPLNTQTVDSNKFLHLKQLSTKSLVLKQGYFHERVSQKYRGLSVFGAEVIHHYHDGEYLNTTGQEVSIKQLSIVPTLSKDKALAQAQKLLPEAKQLKATLLVFPGSEATHLAWSIEQQDSGQQWQVFIDAHNGSVLDYFSSIAEGTGPGVDGVEKEFPSIWVNNNYVLKDIENTLSTFNLKNCFGCSGSVMTSINDYWEDKAAVDAHDFAYRYMNILKQDFGRAGFDNKGSPLKVNVHLQRNYVQAEWSLPNNISFGDGDQRTSTFLSGGLDVVAHEITHGVTAYSSKLIYRGESGALNEGFSDIMGTYAEFRLQNDRFDWMLGEDVWTPATPGDALRYMHNPTLDQVSRDHYESRYIGSRDNGGVHYNSGIVNLAFYLAAQGGQHPNVSSVKVTGIGVEMAGKIFFEAFTNYLTSNANFNDARKACLLVAERFGTDAVNSISLAWKAVGVE